LPPPRRTIKDEARADPDGTLLAGARSLGVPLGAQEVLAFRTYRDEILRWSARANLTALSTPLDIVRHGFLDSLACVPLFPAHTRRVVDIGSGVGFPAIPVAIVRPDIRIDLVESSRKRVTFLRHIGRLLNLPGISVRPDRSETLLRVEGMLGVFDVALARAVAPLDELGPSLLPFLKTGGVFLAQVGSGTDIAAAVERLERVGFALRRETSVSESFGAAGRRILTLEKA
jgi:16S rRNA (guanine527-N7)-methyltransferase